MPILHYKDPNCQQVIRCFKCRKVGHVMSQCLRKKKNMRCASCGSTHKKAHCPVKKRAASPEVAITGDSRDAGGKKMMLLECIALLDCIEYLPTHCAKCGHQNLEHLEMECPMYEQCISCYQRGPKGFVRCHSCSVVSEVSWGANTDYYKGDWYLGRD